MWTCLLLSCSASPLVSNDVQRFVRLLAKGRSGRAGMDATAEKLFPLRAGKAPSACWTLARREVLFVAFSNCSQVQNAAYK